MRSETKAVRVRGVTIGGGAPVSVQSMTNTDTRDVEATIAQAGQLQAAGCDIVRISVPSAAAAEAFAEIRRRIELPLVADVHFTHRPALMAIEAGADKLRINPGTIGNRDQVREIAELALDHEVPIRVGVNSGSVEERHLRGSASIAEALVKSALSSTALLESFGHKDLVISVKASSVPETLEAYRQLARQTSYPLHLGLTEAGTRLTGAVKSAVAIGVLLEEDIGDTIRVSLAADPIEEVGVGWTILRGLGLRRRGIDLIACPTCARCQVDVIGLAEEAERRLASVESPLTVAVMGCAVNGPGEARHADVGIAAEKGSGQLFADGEVIGTYPEEQLLEVLVDEVERRAAHGAPASGPGGPPGLHIVSCSMEGDSS